MSHLADIGINVIEENCNDVIRNIFNNHKDKAFVLEKKGVVYVLLTIDENIELWFPVINGMVHPNLIGLHYNSGSIIELSNVKWISSNEHKSEGLLTGVNQAFYMNLTVPNMAFEPQLDELESYRLIVSCFAEKVDFYKDVEDYRKNDPLGEKLHERSFVPVGMLDKENQSSVALIRGIVNDIKECTNSVTNQKYYVVTISCYDNDFELLISHDKMPSEIGVGYIASGQFWLSGKFI